MKIYPTMIADVSQDNMVGLLKIAAFLVIFVMINLGLVNACSQLINVIPDQVIAWVGGQFQNTLGRNGADEIAGKVSHALNAGALGHMGKDIATARNKARLDAGNGSGVKLNQK